mgnify:CR=1 FL=1
MPQRRNVGSSLHQSVTFIGIRKTQYLPISAYQQQRVFKISKYLQYCRPVFLHKYPKTVLFQTELQNVQSAVNGDNPRRGSPVRWASMRGCWSFEDKSCVCIRGASDSFFITILPFQTKLFPGRDVCIVCCSVCRLVEPVEPLETYIQTNW